MQGSRVFENQELLTQGSRRGNQYQDLMQLLPADHKAKWLAGSALTASDQSMNSIMSTVLSKLNAFLDTELEQVLCFDGSIDAELFVNQKCAIFLILPEEDATKNFVASLMIQNLARELFSVANEYGGRLPNRAVFFCDELKSMPKGNFVVMKTGTHPMKTRLKLFFEWGIRFDKPLEMHDRGSRPVRYAGKADLEEAILKAYPYINTACPAPMQTKPEQASKPMPMQVTINTE